MNQWRGISLGVDLWDSSLLLKDDFYTTVQPASDSALSYSDENVLHGTPQS